MHKYEVIIYWSNEDEVFVAEVPELPGCMAHGDTKAEALASADEAIQLWIDTAQEFGDPIPEAKGQRLMLA
ncbi:MAG: type II toxin-antitoxin system HicB family antitoxin [Acidobacteriota bacterium]|nr:type II toxin-antitoxin system HicB family antitoxin [Acidobacteriota bacterium]